MTLIGTLASDTVVVQVSDRRITWLRPDGSTTLRDDLTNKAVLFENRATLAFTGLAELEGQRTDRWIASRLAESSDLGTGLERLMKDLTALFRYRPYRGHSHSIVVTGWKRNGLDEPTPFTGLVSNQFEVGRGWARRPACEFDWFIQPGTPGRPTLVFAPDIAFRSDSVALYRQLLRVKDRGIHVGNAVALMAETIRSVAHYRPTVGRELMVAVLPKSAVPRGPTSEMMVLNGAVSPVAPTFYTLSANGDPVSYGPTMILNGMTITDYQLTIPPDEPLAG